MIRTDIEAFAAYPNSRAWYDKLYLAKMFGYICGTSVIPYDGKWIVRPITNLEGMGLGASISVFHEGTIIPPDTFYCQVFGGRHITIDYVRKNNMWVQTDTFEGFNTHDNLIQFSKWKRISFEYTLPLSMDFIESDYINIEIIGNHIIEVHLRPNPDPVMYDEFWPIWSEDQLPPSDEYVRIPDRESHIGRLGFYVPKKR